ncbi:inverse autotransporter beta domain-containing protein [Vibrio mediterranei]
MEKKEVSLQQKGICYGLILSVCFPSVTWASGRNRMVLPSPNVVNNKYIYNGHIVSDKSRPLWVMSDASIYSSWEEVSRKTGTPLSALLAMNEAKPGSDLDISVGHYIWIYAPTKDMLLASASSNDLKKDSDALPLLGSSSTPPLSLDSPSPVEETIASELSQAGQVISNGGVSAYADNLEARAESYGDSKLEQGVTDWLSSYGTSRFSLDLLKNLDDPSASFDMLLPLYDNRRQLFFTQFGYQLNSKSVFSGRDFLNLGMGFRTRTDGFLLGINAFYDMDGGQIF